MKRPPPGTGTFWPVFERPPFGKCGGDASRRQETLGAMALGGNPAFGPTSPPREDVRRSPAPGGRVRPGSWLDDACPRGGGPPEPLSSRDPESLPTSGHFPARRPRLAQGPPPRVASGGPRASRGALATAEGPMEDRSDFGAARRPLLLSRPETPGPPLGRGGPRDGRNLRRLEPVRPAAPRRRLQGRGVAAGVDARPGSRLAIRRASPSGPSGNHPRKTSRDSLRAMPASRIHANTAQKR